MSSSTSEWQKGDYGDFLELSDEERAIVEMRLKRELLERAVIEAAKKWRAADLNSSRDLINAVDDLYYFESEQETK